METIEFCSKVKNGIIRIPQKYKNIENANVKINISYQDFLKDENSLDKIGISVKKEIVNSFGINYIRNFIEKQLQFLYIEQIKQGIDK